MSGELDKKAVYISVGLYNQIEKRTRNTGFGSVEEYITFVLEEVLKDEEDEEQVIFTEKEEEEVKKRLRSLGYLD